MKDLEKLTEQACKALDDLLNNDDEIPALVWVEAFSLGITALIRQLNSDYRIFMASATEADMEILHSLSEKLEEMDDMQYNNDTKH